ENTLHNTLVVAQETAEGVRAAAKKEAELIVKEAQATVQKMIYDAEEKVKETATDCDKIKKQEQAIRAQIKNLLLTQLELLKSSEEQPAYQDKIID
ncbi:MAG: DivIVA domain-containing protein, partial [Negativicutes bacterium]|nr:DivIVA domain-containing protein [Negativicutes bacterium]